MATAKKVVSKTAVTPKEKKTTKKVGLSAPWTHYGNLIINLFKKDDDVKITTDVEEKDGIYNIYISSDNVSKLAAMEKVLGEEKVFGNITVKINYEDTSSACTLDDFVAAFKDTEYLICYEHIETEIGSFDCPVVAKEIIQFFNDDITDGYGNENITVADAISEVFYNKPANMLITTANGSEDK